MLKEYYNFIKKYIKISQLNKFYLVLTIITAVLYKTALVSMPLFASWIIKYATLSNFPMVYASLLYLAIAYILYDIFYLANYKIYKRNMTQSYDKIQTKILDKLIGIDDGFTNKISKGKLLNSVNNDVMDIGDMMDEVSELISNILLVIYVFAIISMYNIWISLIMLVYALIYINVKNKADRNIGVYLKKQNRYSDKYSSLFAQILSGMQEIKTFNMIPKLKEILDEIKKGYSKNYLKRRKFVTIKNNDARFITHLFRILLYVYVVIMIINSKMTVDVLVLIVGYHENLITYLDNLLNNTSKIREVSISVDRIASIFEYDVLKPVPYGIYDKDDIDGIVEFKNVYFGYNDKQILNNISFKIKPHTVTAIVGQSGGGKTSIINLLLRLYKLNSGNILIDGVNIYDYTKEVYNSNVAVVNQKPFIFNMSIRKNLDFVDNNIYNQIETCKRVGIHDFIMTLPKGYDTILKENATNISGGQKQLISLARTLLSKAEILLLDEITSSLDPDTALHISLLMKELKKDHTIITITHKPELMKVADRLIVLDKGKIVGDGKHKDLIVNNEYYKWLQTKKSVSKLGVFDNDKELN